MPVITRKQTAWAGFAAAASAASCCWRFIPITPLVVRLIREFGGRPDSRPKLQSNGDSERQMSLLDII